MSLKQKTLNTPISFQGKGLHTGLNVTMTVNPAEPGFGIKFRRIDLEGTPVVEALADYVTDTSRGTTIEKKGVRISTIEHVMAALWGCGIDNALIDIDAPETPIMDGSAREYVAAIIAAGLKEQDADREYYEIHEKTVVSVPERGVEIVVYPDDEFSVNVNVDFNSKIIGNQYARLDSIDQFAEQIAPCRTFVFLHELEPLITHNLIKGGDLDNAIVIVENKVSDEELDRLSKLFNKKDVQVNEGYLNNIQLRSSHPKFKYDPNQEALYDINKIRKLLPHRPPFLLVDKIIHLDSQNVVGIKNVTMNEPFFVGHFPNEPVMPGVLIIEAMAQCGGILALSSVPDPENYSTYFLKIDGVKFRDKIVPGDTLQFELRLAEPIRRGIVVMEAKAFVGNKFTTEAMLMAQIVHNK